LVLGTGISFVIITLFIVVFDPHPNEDIFLGLLWLTFVIVGGIAGNTFFENSWNKQITSNKFPEISETLD